MPSTERSSGAGDRGKAIAKVVVVSVLLVGSLVFMLAFWNSGKYVRVYENIGYSTEEKEDPELLEGDKYVVQEGTDGVRVVYYIDEGEGKRGRKLHSEVVKEPTTEIIMVGSKPESQVISDAEDAMRTAMESWKSGDFQKLVDCSNPDSLQGATAQSIADAYSSTGETLSGYTIGSLTLYRNDEWMDLEEEEYGWGSSERVQLSRPSTLGKAALVGEVNLDLSLRSPNYGDALIKGTAYMLYVEKQWKLQYWGALSRVDVGQTKTEQSERWMEGEEIIDVTIDSVVRYTDHFSVLASEKNRSTGTSEWSDSAGSLLDSLSVESDDIDYITRLDEFSTDFESSVNDGSSQSGMVSYEPSLDSGDVLYVEAGYDVEFDPIKIP